MGELKVTHTPRATIDFEWRSPCVLKKVGSWRASLDPRTQILCLAYRLPHWAEGETGIWVPAIPEAGIEEHADWDLLYELLEWVDMGGLVEAHNAWFERGVWRNIIVPRYRWPDIPHRSWRCSAAKAAALALPRALEKAQAAMKLSLEKDATGSKLMKKMMKPRAARKKEAEEWALENFDEPMPLLWHISQESIERLCDYCRMDVLSEEELSKSIPDLSEEELEVFLLDQLINERGFGLDREAIEAALKLIDVETDRLNVELCALTNGQVKKATNRGKMQVWLAEQGTELPNMQGATIDEELKRPEAHSESAIRGMQIMRTLGRSSTAKYEAMQNWICPDNRAHGGLLYHGASTGRWTGAGIQPQNFPRGTIKDWDMEKAWEVLKTFTIDEIRALWGDVMAALAQALRGVIVPGPGKELHVADYSGIEARVLLWMADDEDGLDIFREGRDIYCEMASDIYGRLITKEDKNERQLGKSAILGCGYQMGWSKFIATALALGGVVIDEETSRLTVETYRAKFWRVREMWDAQQEAAINATRAPGRPFPCGRVEWLREGRFLFCTLPSGRRLAYADPQVHLKATPWGEKRNSLSFMGVNPVTKRWERQYTYGGSLVENQVQAVARDLMADAMMRCEQEGVYQVVLSVHDELIAEADIGKGSVKGFETLLSTIPDWAEGCPITAEGWSGMRYRK